ncbi:MAG TPA: S8/S53 family peptidase, partial [Thermomicrobiales bacterium]|nr:S8/S53 family peptidase [Thermomicrobiales bacterium]
AAEITRRTNLVRDLVNAAGGLLPLDHLSGRIRAVAPNWLAAASQYTCPSPGAKPEPIKRPAKGCLRFFLPTRPARGRWRFTFTNREIERLVAGQRSGGEPCPDVTVAILDTSPERGDVDASTGRYPHNLQLADLCKAQYVRIDQDPGLSWPQSYFDRLNGYVPNWRDNLDGKGGTHLDVFFKMPDHGLFAAGIVHDIAPRCAIHLIRVIGGYGVTDLRALVPTLEALPRAFLKSDNQRLVVNLSLGFAIPPGEQLLRAWLKEAYDAIEVDLGGHPDLKSALDALEQKNRSGVYQALQAYLDSLHADVQVIIDWINAEKYALIVAAAGNDTHFFPPPGTIPAGSPRPMRPEPRWPARYDEALGVASVGLGGAAANFSNRGDVTQMGNGVATFGGNASLPTGSPLVLSSSAPTVPPTMTLGTIDTSSGDPDRIDAAKGLYCSDPVCLGGGKNETGWVYWAGTSFSTPVISALAAALWCEHGAEADCWDFGQVINKIVSLAAATGSATDPERLDCPTITARQRFVKG